MISSPAQVVGPLGSAVDTATDLPVPESLQAQIDNLQNIVNALNQEDAFEWERLTWDAGDEHHDEKEADPPLRKDAAPSIPKRRAIPCLASEG